MLEWGVSFSLIDEEYNLMFHPQRNLQRKRFQKNVYQKAPSNHVLGVLCFLNPSLLKIRLQKYYKFYIYQFLLPFYRLFSKFVLIFILTIYNMIFSIAFSLYCIILIYYLT